MCLYTIVQLVGLYYDPKGQKVFGKHGVDEDPDSELITSLRNRIKRLEDQLNEVSQNCMKRPMQWYSFSYRKMIRASAQLCHQSHLQPAMYKIAKLISDN